ELVAGPALRIAARQCRDLPARGEALGVDTALRRQEAADESRMRPVGGKLQCRLVAHGQEFKLPAAVELEVDGEVMGAERARRLQRGMDAAGEDLLTQHAGHGRERLAVELEGQLAD